MQPVCIKAASVMRASILRLFKHVSLCLRALESSILRTAARRYLPATAARLVATDALCGCRLHTSHLRFVGHARADN